MKVSWGVLVGAFGLIALSSNAYAIEWTIGAGVGVAPDYEGSEDYEAVPLWNLRGNDLYHEKTYAQILGPKLNSNLLPHDNFRLGLSAQYVFERDDVDNNAVDNLSSTDDGLLIGVMGGYDFLLPADRVIGLEVDFRWDTNDDIGGLLTLRGKYSMPFADAWTLNAAVESTWASDDYMEEYFGIDAVDSARSGLNQFDADSGFKDIGLNASVTYKITDSWSTTGSLAYKRLLTDAEDSPVTDDEGSADQIFAGLLVNFKF